MISIHTRTSTSVFIIEFPTITLGHGFSSHYKYSFQICFHSILPDISSHMNGMLIVIFFFNNSSAFYPFVFIIS